MLIECNYCQKHFIMNETDANRKWEFCSIYCEEQQIRKDCGLSHGIYMKQDEEC